jgi:hypothetical protein
MLDSAVDRYEGQSMRNATLDAASSITRPNTSSAGVQTNVSTRAETSSTAVVVREGTGPPKRSRLLIRPYTGEEDMQLPREEIDIAGSNRRDRARGRKRAVDSAGELGTKRPVLAVSFLDLRREEKDRKIRENLECK